MKNNLEKDDAGEWLRDLPVQTENLAFDRKELIVCGKCRRQNPPNRLNCLYCAWEFEMPDEQKSAVKPILRTLEIWEKGLNLIRSSNSGDADFSEAAKVINAEKDFLREICELNKKLPLVRVESEEEAEIVQDNLKKIGIETFVLSDETLAVNKPNHRLRGIEFSAEKIILILFNNDEIYEIPLENISLIVEGVLFERKVESKEKRSKKGENKVVDSIEVSSDEMMIDIYDEENPVGFRILSKGFDFSCLGAEKGILAARNMKKLAEKLQEIAPNAKFAGGYLKDREYLGDIWEIEHRTNSKGLKREGFGRLNIENTSATSNLLQFNKYSRMQRYIK